MAEIREDKGQPTSSIIVALIRAQADFEHVKKDAVNPHFRSKYATLESVISATKDALTKNGIFITQSAELEGNNQWVLKTTALHISGDSLSSMVPMTLNAAKGDQGTGSSLSYCRRYGLLALLGIAAEDDDGEGTQIRNQPTVIMATQTAPRVPQNTMPTVPKIGGPSEPQLKRLWAISKQANVSEAVVDAMIKDKFGETVTRRTLNREQYDTLCDLLSNNRQEDEIPFS